MRRRTTAFALTGAVVVASGAYALGSEAHDGSAEAARKKSAASSQGARSAHFGDRGHGRHGMDSSALAGALGVSTAQLEQAFDELRSDMEAREAERRKAFSAALAERLKISAVKVEEVLGSMPRFKPRHR